MASTKTSTLRLRFTEEQISVIEQMQSDQDLAYTADLVRLAMAQYAANNGYDWPDYEWVRNEDRRRLKIRGRKSE